MAIQKRKRKSGTVYRVLWRDEAGRQRSRTFTRSDDARTFDAQVKLAKRRGELAQLDAGKQTLKEFEQEWWALYALPHLSPKTRRLYESFRDRHLVPALGDVPLRRLTPERIARFSADLAAAGVGNETIRKTLAMLQGILERAVEWGRLDQNPVRHVRKPEQGRRRAATALSPSDVESIRGRLLKEGRMRDATLVSVLAYAGLRPGEALALRWRDIGEQTILIEKALSLGQETSTKTRRMRSVRLLAPLATDLAEWRMASGRPDDAALVFPTPVGSPWAETDWRNWRNRRFREAASATGIKARPYDLRHSFASLLFAEQRNPAEIAEQLGHSLQTLFGTYTHVIEELRGQDRVQAEDVIRAARRGGDVAQKLPELADTNSGGRS